jgi:hypothetical protein
VAERGKPGHVVGVEWASVGGEMFKGGLPDLVVLAELAALPVEDVAGQRVAAVTPAEQVMDRAAICRVVDVFEHVQSLDYPSSWPRAARRRRTPAGRTGSAVNREVAASRAGVFGGVTAGAAVSSYKV